MGLYRGRAVTDKRHDKREMMKKGEAQKDGRKFIVEVQKKKGEKEIKQILQ